MFQVGLLKFNIFLGAFGENKNKIIQVNIESEIFQGVSDPSPPSGEIPASSTNKRAVVI